MKRTQKRVRYTCGAQCIRGSEHTCVIPTLIKKENGYQHPRGPASQHSPAGPPLLHRQLLPWPLASWAASTRVEPDVDRCTRHALSRHKVRPACGLPPVRLQGCGVPCCTHSPALGRPGPCSGAVGGFQFGAAGMGFVSPWCVPLELGLLGHPAGTTSGAGDAEPVSTGDVPTPESSCAR